MTFFDVVVIGGGASGLMCALTAGKRGRSVLALDHTNRMGRKILASGGGRCNFTNLLVESHNFISSNPHFCKSALKRFTQWDFIAMVEKHAVSYSEREHGQLFCNDSSSDILEMLLHECKKGGVTFLIQTKISEIETIKGDISKNRGFLLRSDKGNWETDSLVIATGGLSYPGLGATNYGYKIARKFGMAVLPTKPALVPLVLTEDIKLMCGRLSGVSLEATLKTEGKTFTDDLLFTHRGISGPVVLQASNYWERGEFIVLDLFPGIDLRSWFLSKKETHGQRSIKNLLATILPRKVVAEIQNIFWQSWEEHPIRSIPDSVLRELSLKLTSWKIKPGETEGLKKAEVTSGGVDTKDLSSKTMESTKQPGLYFIGEVIDVTGQLGGYNLQWAWSSGYAAGQFV